MLQKDSMLQKESMLHKEFKLGKKSIQRKESMLQKRYKDMGCRNVKIHRVVNKRQRQRLQGNNLQGEKGGYIQEKIAKNNRGAVFPCYSTWPGQSRTRKKDPTGIVKLLRCKRGHH
jgi:hypothetical protein